MPSSTSLFLTPTDPRDVFVTLGSGEKYHVVLKERLGDGTKVMVRCGRKGLRAKATIRTQHGMPNPNVASRHSVCQDCREFTRGIEL